MREPSAPPDLKGVIAGTKPVETIPFRLVQQFCDQVLALGGILAIRGPGGSGKTYAVRYWADRASVTVVQLHLDSKTSRYEMLRAVLAGLGRSTDGTGEILKERLRQTLSRRRLVVFVDEANLLDIEALRSLRYLHDQGDAEFALVFTGVDFEESFAGIPEFPSRVKRWVTFEPLTGNDLLSALASTHPVLAATGTAVLRRLDDRYARGLWRHWANVLEYAIAAGATAESGITEPMVKGCLSALCPPPQKRKGKNQ